MALEVQCAVCGETLNEPGAIILSPPDEEDRAIKEHLDSIPEGDSYVRTNAPAIQD